MCLKCILLFIIPCFREPDEKKIEVEEIENIMQLAGLNTNNSVS